MTKKLYGPRGVMRILSCDGYSLERNWEVLHMARRESGLSDMIVKLTVRDVTITKKVHGFCLI